MHRNARQLAQARAGGSSTAPVGIFALLDEQCRLPKCTHKTFTEKIFEVRFGRVSDRGQGASSYTRAAPRLTPLLPLQVHKKAHSVGTLGTVTRGAGLMPNEGFVVKHYAGTVLRARGRASSQRVALTYTHSATALTPSSPLLYHRYHTEGFLQKNNNMLHSDLELVLKAATDPFVATMVAEAEVKLAAQGEEPEEGRRRQGRAVASVSAHFLGQLNQLTTTETRRHRHNQHLKNRRLHHHVLHHHRLHHLLHSPLPETPPTPSSTSPAR